MSGSKKRPSAAQMRKVQPCEIHDTDTTHYADGEYECVRCHREGRIVIMRNIGSARTPCIEMRTYRQHRIAKVCALVEAIATGSAGPLIEGLANSSDSPLSVEDRAAFINACKDKIGGPQTPEDVAAFALSIHSLVFDGGVESAMPHVKAMFAAAMKVQEAGAAPSDAGGGG
jgi:hypothetical protein